MLNSGWISLNSLKLRVIEPFFKEKLVTNCCTKSDIYSFFRGLQGIRLRALSNDSTHCKVQLSLILKHLWYWWRLKLVVIKNKGALFG